MAVLLVLIVVSYVFGGVSTLFGSIFLPDACNPNIGCKDIQLATLEDVRVDNQLHYYYYPSYYFTYEHAWHGRMDCFYNDEGTRLDTKNETFVPKYDLGKEYNFYMHYNDAYDYVRCDPNLEYSYETWKASIVLLSVGGFLVFVGTIMLIFVKCCCSDEC